MPLGGDRHRGRRHRSGVLRHALPYCPVRRRSAARTGAEGGPPASHHGVAPLVENGLNLPPSGGIPVVIDGVTYYYAVSYNSSGELYEYWFNANGDLVWARHHSNHRTPWKHDDPHDHKGGKDKNGKNTLDGGPQPIDDRYKTPDQLSNRQSHSNEALGYALAGVVAGVAIYQITKWTIATIFAPITGGGSFFAAALAT